VLCCAVPVVIMVEDHENESNEDEEERPVFCPYTRESLLQSEARIAEEEAKRNERKKKAEESEVTITPIYYFSIVVYFSRIYTYIRYFI
jgi:hypothetical protein